MIFYTLTVLLLAALTAEQEGSLQKLTGRSMHQLL